MFKEVYPREPFQLIIPENEKEKQETIAALSLEIANLKETKKKKAKEEEENLELLNSIQAEERKNNLQNKRPKKLNPPDASPNVVEFQKKIKQVYDDDIDYDQAITLLIACDDKIESAIEYYSNHFIATIKFEYGSKNFTEPFCMNKTGDDLVAHLVNYLKTYEEPGVALKLHIGGAKTKPISDYELAQKNLFELGITKETTIVITKEKSY